MSAPLYPLLPTSTPAPTITPSPTATLAPIPTATLTAYAPACLASQLRMTAAFGGAAMGHLVARYQFTNVSATACSLQGFPSARLLDSAGHALDVKIAQVATAYGWNNVPANKVQLTPGGAAYFAVGTTDVPETGQTCVTAASTTIYPPQSASGFVSSVKLGTCDGEVDISPIVAQQSDL